MTITREQSLENDEDSGPSYARGSEKKISRYWETLNENPLVWFASDLRETAVLVRA